jgi:hypothetical protein
MISGTGLSHLGSAANRQKMHAAMAATSLLNLNNIFLLLLLLPLKLF